jgi:hypothetical protein
MRKIKHGKRKGTAKIEVKGEGNNLLIIYLLIYLFSLYFQDCSTEAGCYKTRIEITEKFGHPLCLER